MGIFTRKSRWEQVLDVMTAAAASGGIRRAAKVGTGVVVGALGVTAMSAAVSSAREHEESR